MKEKTTILIVDDHPLFREGLKTIIARDPKFEVVGEAGSGEAALRMGKSLTPNLILLDISLPDKDGIQLTQSLLSILPETRIVIVSMHSKIDYITRAFQAGAMGYVVKESATAKLLQGLDLVIKGEYYLDSAISQQVVKRLMEFPEKEAKITDAAYKSLTPREQEVMRLISQELSTKTIAEKLCISPKTVENHRANIMAKLDLHSTMELVRYAAKLGLIDVDLWKD